jgi:hypothetical protein
MLYGNGSVAIIMMNSLEYVHSIVWDMYDDMLDDMIVCERPINMMCGGSKAVWKASNVDDK